MFIWHKVGCVGYLYYLLTLLFCRGCRDNIAQINPCWLIGDLFVTVFFCTAIAIVLVISFVESVYLGKDCASCDVVVLLDVIPVIELTIGGRFVLSSSVPVYLWKTRADWGVEAWFGSCSMLCCCYLYFIVLSMSFGSWYNWFSMHCLHIYGMLWSIFWAWVFVSPTHSKCSQSLHSSHAIGFSSWFWPLSSNLLVYSLTLFYISNNWTFNSVVKLITVVTICIYCFFYFGQDVFNKSLELLSRIFKKDGINGVNNL